MEWNGAPQKIWKISQKWEVAIEDHFEKLMFLCMSSKCIKLSEKKIFVIAGFHYTCEHQLLHVANSIEKIQYSYILLSNSK